MDPTAPAIQESIPAQKTTTDPEDTYFANLPDDLIGDAIWERKREYEKFLKQSGLYALYRKMHWKYYGHDVDTAFTTHGVGQDGRQGELHILRMNHLRSIITAWLNMVRSQRPAVTPVAINDDYESELEVKRGKALLDHERGPSGASIEAREAETREFAGLYGHGFLLQLWNEGLGEVVMPTAQEAGMELAPGEDLEQSKRTGDIEAWALSPLDVFFDPRRKDSKFPWIICRIFKSRHDIAARFPAFREQILELKTQADADGTDGIDFSFAISRTAEPASESAKDELPVYILLHDKTEAVVEGKQVIMLDAKTILRSGPLGYKKKPCRRLAAATIDRTPFGFSPAWDQLAPQEAADSLATIGLTNARTFGLGVMTSPKGSDVELEQLAEGLVLLPYTPGMDPPKPIQMPTTPDQVFQFRREMIGEQGTILGVNSVIRGDPEASLKSGSALALVQAQGVQFSNDFQENDVRFIEEHSIDTIEICQLFMEDERKFEIVGAHVASLTLPFTGQQLNRITKVRVQIVNPLSKTIAGKMQIAETLAERFSNQLTPGDFFRVAETGSGEHLTKRLDQKSANIDRENELLSQGIGPIPQVPKMAPDGQPMMGPDGNPVMMPQREPGKTYIVCLITDDHRAHVEKHLEVVDNPAVRGSENPIAVAVVKAVLDHIDEHEKMLTALTVKRPGLLELTKQMPLQAALPPPMLGPGQPGEKPKQMGPGSSPKAAAPEAPVLQPTPADANHQPRMPQMPVNPSTGNRAESPGPH